MHRGKRPWAKSQEGVDEVNPETSKLIELQSKLEEKEQLINLLTMKMRHFEVTVRRLDSTETKLSVQPNTKVASLK